MRTASNFNVTSGVNISGYARPRIDRVSHRSITVDTSLGPRRATEVTIRGEHFAIRGVSPEVRVNALPLVSFRISNDTRSITGYLFEDLHAIHHVLVDYGLGARGEWWRRGSRPALLILLILILLALLFLSLGLAAIALVLLVIAGVTALLALLFGPGST
jgi:hypothetical protein